MKKMHQLFIVFFLMMGFSCLPFARTHGQTIIIDVIKEATKKVIRAIDLQVQRIQNKTIDLQNAQKQIENALSKLKLHEIAEWTEKQKQLYEQYFDEMWRVKSIITYWKRITEIIEKEKQLVREYKRVFALIKEDRHFTDHEVEYMYSVYSGILFRSTESLDQILVLLQSFTTQMSDAGRLELLNNAAGEIEACVTDIRRFTDQNAKLSLQRARSMAEINIIKQLYGIQ